MTAGGGASYPRESTAFSIPVLILGCEYLVDMAASLGQPVITVAIQYRLGWLGFLASNDFEEEAEHANRGYGGGNWGLIDQRNGFLWVKKHIAEFGGDPNNVTAFGRLLFDRAYTR
jgi:carboxylesterase type B